MNKCDMRIKIAGVEFENTVMTASGTFGSGKEYGEYVDINEIGAVITKGVSSTPWRGNNTPRIAETYGGILNSVGLQNPGVEEFIEKDIKFLRQFDTKIIVNIVGRTFEEYCEVARRLSSEDIDLVELNISCPNVKEGGVAFGTDPKMIEYITKEVKKNLKHPLIVKLSPNVTDIVEMAKAAVDGGADAISMINTLIGMAIDIHKKRPVLANTIGGLSGPAIKPVALRMVYQVAKAIDIPIIGMGGIMNGEDAIEFILAGATAVAIGTANFANPRATIDVIEGIENYLAENSVDSISEIRGLAIVT
ncbi:MAG: dihydroorotate dehydrogenase [Clostridiales bacterium]|nr:dihydroorotate dehydrogenase [Clostridiales bacterium]